MQLIGGKWRAKKSFIIYLGSKGWLSVESTRLPPMWPGFKSRRRRHMWVEFVVGSLLFTERFFSGFSGFPLSPKTNIFKFQFDQESGRRRTTLCRDVLPPNHFIRLFILIRFVFSQKYSRDSLSLLPGEKGKFPAPAFSDSPAVTCWPSERWNLYRHADSVMH